MIMIMTMIRFKYYYGITGIVRPSRTREKY